MYFPLRYGSILTRIPLPTLCTVSDLRAGYKLTGCPRNVTSPHADNGKCLLVLPGKGNDYNFALGFMTLVNKFASTSTSAQDPERERTPPPPPAAAAARLHAHLARQGPQ